MAYRILVTARSFRATEGPHKQLLRDAGCEVIDCPNEHPLTAQQLALWIVDADAVILGLDRVTDEALAGAERLRVISRHGVGIDSVDVAAATRRRIAVTVTPGANSLAVAELTLALTFALARDIPYHDRTAREGKWTRRQGVELAGATLGIIGLGRIGQEVAVRAAALGMRVLYYDPLVSPADPVVSVVEPCPLDDLLASADVVSLHLPLTRETRAILDGAALARMKPGALLVNTARGGLVDEEALYRALVAGRLGGAACDVFAQDPPSGSPLLSLDNFIATPHIGSATRQTALKMGLMAAQNALAVLRGERPAATVNPEVFEDA